MELPLVIELREPTIEDYERAAVSGNDNKDEGEGIKVEPMDFQEVGKLLERADPIEKEKDDEKEFFKRKESMKPPKKGELIQQKFPPEISLEKPEEVLKEEEETKKELKVIRSMPTGEDLETVPQVIVTFNQPMVPLTGVDDIKKYPVPAKMTPQVEGEWRYIGTNTLKWKPTHRLPKSTSFCVTVPKGVSSELGVCLQEEYSFQFSTRTLSVKNFYPRGSQSRHGGSCIGEDGLVFIEFNQKVDAKEILKFVEVRYGSLNAAVTPFVISNEEAIKRLEGNDGHMKKKNSYLYHGYHRAMNHCVEGCGFFVAFKEKLPVSNRFTFRVKAGACGVEGPKKLPKDLNEYFQTYESFRMVSISPRQGDKIVPNQHFHLSFSNPIDLDVFDPKTMVKATPEIENMTVLPRGPTINIHGKTKGATTYIIEVNPSMVDIYGQHLLQEERAVFEVGRADQDLFGFHNRQMIVHDSSMNKEPCIDLVTINLDKVRVVIQQVEPREFMKCPMGRDYHLYAHQRDGPIQQRLNAGKNVYDEIIEIKHVKDELTETKVFLSKFLQHKTSGQLLFYAEPEEKSWTKDFRSRPTVQTWVQVTRLAVDALIIPGRELVGVCSNLETGMCEKDVKFTLQGSLGRQYVLKEYEKNSISVLGEDDGTAYFSNFEYNYALLIAKKGDDIAFVPSVYSIARSSDRLLSYVINDRNLYKPKETVSIKGILRWMSHEGWGKKLQVIENENIKWELTGPRGRSLQKGIVKTNEFGSFFFEVKLPDNINLGTCYVRFHYRPNVSFTHNFKVQEFRTPEFQSSAKVLSQGPFFMNGVSIVEAKAEYFSGGGLSGCDVNWIVRQQPTSYSPPGFSFNGFNFAANSLLSPFGGHILGNEPVALQGTTDGTGGHKITVDFKENKNCEFRQPVLVNCDLNIQDINRQNMSSSSSFIVHPSKNYVGIKMKKYFCKKGDVLPMDIVTTDLEGTLVKREVEMKIVNRVWVRKGYDWKEEEHLLNTLTFTTETEKPTEFTVKVPEGGNYHFTCRIKDEDGNANECSSSIWVSGGVERKQSPHGKIPFEVAKLIGNKKEYEAGETAKILVTSPFTPAEGILTVCCNGLVEKKRFLMKEDSEIIEVAIRKEFSPSVGINVLLTGQSLRTDPTTGRDVTDENVPKRPAFARGTIMIQVPPKLYDMDVEVTPKKKILKPGEKSEVDIKICSKDESFKGKKAAVSVIIVDEAVLSLTGYNLPHPISNFVPFHDTSVNPISMRSNVALEKNWDVIQVKAAVKPVCCNCCDSLFSFSGGAMNCCCNSCSRSCSGAKFCKRSRKCKKNCCCKQNLCCEECCEDRAGALPEGGEGGGEETSKISIRSDFRPLCCFIHDTTTNENGEITVPFTLPDNLTQYRVWVLSTYSENESNAHLFGLGESSIQAQLPLAIRPSLPRFLNFGDQSEFCVVLQNQALEALEVKVAVRMTNLRLMDAEKIGSKVVIPCGKRAELRFPVTTSKCGTGRFQVVASVVGKDFTDAVEKSLPIFTPSTSEAFATYGEMDGDSTILQTVEAPKNVFTQFGGLNITTSSTALQSLTDAFLYLYNYQFDCVEQISSRVLSILALKDFLFAFNVPNMPSKESINETVAFGLKKVQGCQRDDGAIGFWSLTSDVSIYCSIFVAHALIRCKQGGYTVDQTMLNRSKSFCLNVERYIQQYTIWYSEATKASLKCFALYVLGVFARANELTNIEKSNVVKKAEELWGKQHKLLSHEGKVWLMLSVFICSPAKEKHPLVVEVLHFVMNNVEESPETAHFITSYGDDGKLVMLHSNRRTDGIILEALCQVDSSNKLIPKIVKGLLAHRKKGKWNSTQENVYILLALKEYFETFENVTPDFVSRIWLGEDYAGEVTFKGREIDSKCIDIPMDFVAKKEKQSLVLHKQGQGRMYYRLGMTYAPKNFDLKSMDYGFIVERFYEGVTSKDHVKKDEKTGCWTFKAGELIQVNLRVTNVSRRFHTALVDYLPAGCEVLNPELKGTQVVQPKAQPEPKTGGFLFGRSRRRHVSRSMGVSRSPFSIGYWSYWRKWYEHVNQRDERVEVFSSYLYPGTHEYSYIMRATTLGEYVIPPAKCEEMYAPELFGRSSNEKVKIMY